MWQEIKYFSVAVTDLEAGIKVYEDMFGLKKMTEITETRWGFRAVMLGNGDRMQVEMVQPSNPESPGESVCEDPPLPRVPGSAIQACATRTSQLSGHSSHYLRHPEFPVTAVVQMPRTFHSPRPIRSSA